MATKLQLIREMADKTASDLTSYHGNWQHFLESAARLYKYSFPDQLLIYAQKPEAIAVAEIDFWNDKFDRWVRRGTKGIALIDDNGHYPRLRHVFDVNDTEPTRENARPVLLWEMRQEHKSNVIAALAKNYDEVDLGDTLVEAFRNIANSLAREYYSDNARDILHRAEDSVLEPQAVFDADNMAYDERDSSYLENIFTDMLANSIAYTLMARCGIDASDEFDEEDFEEIASFNTTDIIYALGTATSEVSEQVLRDIEIVVKKYERTKAAERTNNHEHEREYGTKLQPIRGLSVTKPNITERTNSDTARQIWTDEESISETAQDDKLQPITPDRKVISTSEGDRPSSESTVGAIDEPVVIADESTRQIDRSDGVDGGDEQLESTGGGNGGARTDLRIEEIISTSAVTPAEVDSILRDGGNDRNSNFRIAVYFSKGKEDNVKFLRHEYLQGRWNHDEGGSGKGFEFTNHNVCAWFDENGISLAIGTTAKSNHHKVTIPWEVAADRIQELMLAGEYISADDFSLALDNEHDELAGDLWDFYRDEMKYIPEEWNSTGGYPEDKKLIKEQLKDGNLRQAILDRLEGDVTTWGYESNKRTCHDPNRLLENMRNAMLPIVIPQNEVAVSESNFKYFITQDEIDSFLTRGSSYSEGKFRILSTFLGDLSDKEKVDFIKNEYGHSGGTWSATDGWHNAEPGKGISISRGSIRNPDAEVNLNWNAVVKRLNYLVQNGHYLTQKELNYLPDYEKLMLVRSISRFYYDLPPEYERPFIDKSSFSYATQTSDEYKNALDFYYPHEAEWNAIHDFLGDNERIESTISQMEYLVENMSTEDRYFKVRKNALEQLEAYRDGTFTLFPRLEKIPTTEEVLARQTETPRRENGVIINLDQPLLYNFDQPIPATEQLSFFDAVLPTVEEQRAKIEQKIEEEVTVKEAISSALEHDIDSFLLDISAENKARLYEQFADNPRSRAAVNLVKEIYGNTLPFPLPQAIKRIETIVETGLFDGIGDPYELFDKVRDELSERGYEASGEIVEDGINEFRSHIGHGDFTDVTDFIVSEYLTEEPEIKTQLHLQQVGAFYEITGDIAVEVAEILDLTLTQRDNIPMIGFPDNMIESYSDKLGAAGFEILIKEPLDLVLENLIDFDTVSKTILEHVMADNDYVEALKTAKNRASLRNPCTWALEQTIRDHETDEPEVFNKYFSDDDFNDKLFDFVLKESWENRPVIEEVVSKTIAPVVVPAINFRIVDDNLGEGGVKTKFSNNVEAIRISKLLSAENRNATPEEQEILSRYIGWGGLPQAFDPDNKHWEKEYVELKNLLTEDEYESARASTLNAHFTPPVVIKAMWEAVERMGFKSGNVLEPSVGVGNFFGLIPQDLWQSKLYGVELDSLTARIAKQLYPKANIQQAGFENTEFSDAFFDLAIGNVPFGNYKVTDTRYKQNFNIHDYFFQKAIDKVRPGGVIAFITSKFTMDSKSADVRKYIAQRAELLGAVRLPNDAFLKNAGTETTMDILFLQKRDRPIDVDLTDERRPVWLDLGMTEDNIPCNNYYIENPEMMLGKMAPFERMNNKFGRDDYTCCIGTEGADLGEQLKAALIHIKGQYVEAEIDDLDGTTSKAIPADTHVKNFSYTVVEDVVYFRENSLMYPVDLPTTTLGRIRGMIELRECVNKLISMQLDDCTDDELKPKQKELSDIYDSFIAEYGLINSTANSRAFNADSSYYLLCSLEILDEDGELERKADMFTKRTIKKKTIITHVDTASEALAVSIGEKARIDLEYMSELTGFSREKLLTDLEGVIFLNIGMADNPERTYVTADEYLSGNVRQKLAVAKAAALSVPSLEMNVKALEAVQPEELGAGEISVRLGSTWVEPEYVQEFMYGLLNTSYGNKNVYQVKYHEYTGEWQVTGKNRGQFSDVSATVTYGTSRMNAYQIIDDTLNLRDVRVYDYTQDADGKDVRVLNKKETMLAQQKQEIIKQKFKNWIWDNPERRQYLVKKYNTLFNSVRNREYDGSHINFGGISPEIVLKQHQLNAIAHILYGGNTLLAHVVGAGKTFEMIAAAMESKRLGLCQKNLFAVPNHLTEQWAGEFLRLYPSANILVATKKDFEMRNRKRFCAKIATGDYDAVIIGHSQLEKIPMSKERQERLINEQIKDIEIALEDLKNNNGERFSIKQMEKTRKSLQAKLRKLLESKKRDDVVTFEELGVDRLYIDESHFFKNLFLVTKMRNVAGLSTSEAQKSSDLFMKCRYMDELTGGKGIIFATGTPISNSITELYTIQRYLQYDALSEKKLLHFDAWASTFGETQTSIELAPEGTGYRARTRFSQFHNLPELMSMFKDVADIQTADMLNLPVPEAIYETVVVEPSELQKEMVQELSERAAAVHNRQVDAKVDNMLKITTDGRKIGLDQRLINPLLPDDPNSKVNACVDGIFSTWNETKSDRLTQLLFCDFSTPNKDGRFNIYEDIRAKLYERGIPEHEIAFIHDADTETRKKELFAKVRQGKVRILFGSTFKMGAGTNCQDRLIELHDLDCPWRPSDLEQRAGRIVRQGNLNPKVHIKRYATSGTFDSYLWQTVQKKQEFIAQIMSSKSPVRSCQDVDETALSYAEIKALCAGNPLIAEKMNLDNEVAKLRMLQAEHKSQHYRLEDSLIKHYPQQIKSVTERIDLITKDIEKYNAQKEKCTDMTLSEGAASVAIKFPGMIIDDVNYTEKEPAAKALLDACSGIIDNGEKKIGEYMGFKLSITFESFSKQIKLQMRGNLTYQIDLGTDAFGNLTRINNALDDLPKRLENMKSQLDDIYKQQEAAKAELALPFEQESKLAEMEARLALLNADLNIDDPSRAGRDGNSNLDIVNDNENRSDDTELPRTGTYGKSAPTFMDSIRILGDKKKNEQQPNSKSTEIEI